MCASLYLSCMYAYMPHDRTSPYMRVPPVAPHHLLYLHFMHQTPLPHSTFHPHPPNLPLPPNATETGIQTHPTSFPSRRLLILRCHYPQVTVRARARYRRHSSRHISLCCPSRWVHKSQTTLQPSNSSTGTLTSCQARERHRKRQFRFE